MNKCQGICIILSTLLIYVDARISCYFQDDTQMFQFCNTTDHDNILHRGVVSDKRKTFSINLNRCHISSMNLEAFYRLPTLAILDLSENKIQHLKLGIFNRTTLLSRLNISFNLLTELPLGLFDHIPELSVLDLEGNHLKTLEAGIFDSLPRLNQLHLSYNSLLGKNFSPNFFQNSRNIFVLSLSGNDMSEANFFNAMNNLNYLFIDNCLFKAVPKFVNAENMKNMRHLSLSSNEISAIDDATSFNNLINVMVLNFTQNRIEFIHEDTFKPLKNLEVLDLRYNKLSVIPVGMFQNIKLLRDINLSHNLIRDVPMNAFAGTVLTKLSFSHNRLTHLHENFLLKVEDAGVMLKLFQFSNNPWQCACLRDLLREVKEMEVTYDADTYDGVHPVCVTTREFICKRYESADDEFIDIYNSII